jgi:hypothetical protein
MTTESTNQEKLRRQEWRYKFAGQAMKGILTSDPDMLNTPPENLADDAATYADALLAKLEETND